MRGWQFCNIMMVLWLVLAVVATSLVATVLAYVLFLVYAGVGAFLAYNDFREEEV